MLMCILFSNRPTLIALRTTIANFHAEQCVFILSRIQVSRWNRLLRICRMREYNLDNPIDINLTRSVAHMI